MPQNIHHVLSWKLSYVIKYSLSLFYLILMNMHYLMYIRLYFINCARKIYISLTKWLQKIIQLNIKSYCGLSVRHQINGIQAKFLFFIAIRAFWEKNAFSVLYFFLIGKFKISEWNFFQLLGVKGLILSICKNFETKSLLGE